jgi:hypothetical protein
MRDLIAKELPVRYDSPWHAYTALREALRPIGEDLTHLCHLKGFLGANAALALQRKGDHITIEIGVERGARHHLGEVRIIEVFPDGERALPPDKVRELAKPRIGAEIQLVEIGKIRDRVQAHYEDWSNAFWRLHERILRHPDKNLVDLELRICLAHADQHSADFQHRCRGDQF